MTGYRPHAPPACMPSSHGRATRRKGLRLGCRRVASAAWSSRCWRSCRNPGMWPLPYLSGEVVACDLGAALKPAGFAVERMAVYSARAAAHLTPQVRDAIAQGAIQVAPVLSVRTASVFRSLLRQEGLEEACNDMVGIALSPRVAEAMRPLPWRVLAVADRPDLDALLDGLCRALAGGMDDAFGRCVAGAGRVLP